MAFTGTTFISQIRRIIHGTLNLAIKTTKHQPNSEPNENDDDTNDSSDDSGTSNEYTEANYPGVLDSELTSLTTAQKNIFIVTVSILFVLSMCGNTCTLFVNFRRKIRPFFRACLISLAFSDLMNTVFLTTAYMSQFTAEYVQIWRLGDLMCSFVPFATTCAILASSMTLVGIAVDRYFAVMKAVIGFWKPSVISCIVCMLCIWLASIAIACPVFTIYDFIPVYILTEEHETSNATGWSTKATTTTITTMNSLYVTTTTTTTMSSLLLTENSLSRKPNINTSPIITKALETSWEGEKESVTETSWEKEAAKHDLSYTLVREQQLVNMCVSDQKNVSLYYAIVFVIIFIPCIAAFFWFNSIIARKLWKRRHVAAVTRKKTLKSNPKINKLKTTNTRSTRYNGNVEQSKCCFLQNTNCNCRSAHSTSTTVPSSLANTLGGKISAPTAASGSSTTTTSNLTTNNSREARHLRMFTIILLMMAVFVFLRLPAWIFLLMRMYGSYTKPQHWILYFVFGILNLASSVLNPLFYTFLTETIQYTLRIKAKVSSLLCGCYTQLCCCCYRVQYGTKNNNNSKNFMPPNANGECHTSLHMENVAEPWQSTLGCCETICGCSGFLRATLRCYQPHTKPEHKYNIQTHSMRQGDENGSKDSGHAINNDKDEGVDCSDDEIDDEDVRDFYEYNQRIYTIFPASLVSSSVNSQVS